MQETQVRSLCQADALAKCMATHCSILAWEVHGQRSLAVYSPCGQKESDMIEHNHNTHTHMYSYVYMHIKCCKAL